MVKSTRHACHKTSRDASASSAKMLASSFPRYGGYDLRQQLLNHLSSTTTSSPTSLALTGVSWKEEIDVGKRPTEREREFPLRGWRGGGVVRRHSSIDHFAANKKVNESSSSGGFEKSSPLTRCTAQHTPMQKIVGGGWEGDLITMPTGQTDMAGE